MKPCLAIVQPPLSPHNAADFCLPLHSKATFSDTVMHVSVVPGCRCIDSSSSLPSPPSLAAVPSPCGVPYVRGWRSCAGAARAASAWWSRCKDSGTRLLYTFHTALKLIKWHYSDCEYSDTNVYNNMHYSRVVFIWDLHMSESLRVFIYCTFHLWDEEKRNHNTEGIFHKMTRWVHVPFPKASDAPLNDFNEYWEAVEQEGEQKIDSGFKKRKAFFLLPAFTNVPCLTVTVIC